MLCSFPTGRTGSSWLNRLRTAKGFPGNGASDLEDFLQNPCSSSSDVHTTRPDEVPTFDSPKDEDKKLFNLMSNVICELFNFGDNCSSAPTVKKSSRKQVNPRICAFSNNGNAHTNNVVMDKASEKATTRCGEVGVVKESNERKDEGDLGDVDLPGFSRTEVTVIDTSYEPWKFEKLLFRKKNVWKVRDKKGRSEIFGNKKKRKLNGCEVDDRHAKIKQKLQTNDGNDEGCQPPLNQDYHPSNTLEEYPDRAPEKVGKDLKVKAVNLLSRKSEKKSSSVVLIKSIPISVKNGMSISKTCLKSKEIKP